MGVALGPWPDRFWMRVDADGDCWLWTGPVDREGYGQLAMPGPRYVKAHRIAYELLVGPIEPGLQVDHLCRVRACVNPDHLEPVSARVNVRRSQSTAAANARKVTCNRGHLFDEANTRVTAKGWRYCRTCDRADHAKAAA